MPAPRTARWTDTFSHDALPSGGMHPVRVDGHDVLLVRDAAGTLAAVEARCPHEGYPLATGKLDGCVLTCSWHNWKFDVSDGTCRLGGEGLRTYPVRVVGGRIEVDVAEPDGSVRIPALVESLDAALHDGDAARALRDGTRLLLSGLDPAHLLGLIARHDALHAEYGTTHTLPVAADLATLLPRFGGPRAMIAVAPAIESCIEANMRLPVRARAEPVDGASFERLAEAVEREDAVLAEGLLRGALRDDVPHAVIDGWMLRLQCAHFTDFGHPLIYTIKALGLLPHLPGDARDDLYPAMLYELVLATREDTLPYWSRYTQRLDDVEAQLPAWHASARADAPYDEACLHDAVVDGTHGEALEALVGALDAGVSAERIAATLVAAAAQRLLRFDVAVDRDPGVAEGWLWATHRFTFASAVRQATERLEHPDVLRLLFQTLAFTHSGRPMDASPDARTSLTPLAVDDVSEILAAIGAKDARLACGRLAGWLTAGRPLQPVADALLEACVSDAAVRPIVVAHVLKTTRAALDEHAALAAHPDRDVPLFAAVRFLASPVVERRVRASAEAAVAWVAERRMPRKLTQ